MMNNILNFKSARFVIPGTFFKLMMQCIVVVALVSCQENTDDDSAIVPPPPIVPPAPIASISVNAREIGGTDTFDELAADPNYVFGAVVNLSKDTPKIQIENKSGAALLFSLNLDSEFKSVLNADVAQLTAGKDAEVVVYAKLSSAAFKDVKTTSLNTIISATSNFAGDESYVAYDTLKIYRTPIVFVHGLASDATTFDPMIARIKESGLYEANSILSADYAATSMAAYNVNTEVVPNAINQIIKMNPDVLIPKVNVVGHSMGGILARLYLQSDLYKGDIASLITIDTPHYGSQGADLLNDLGVNHPGTFFETLMQNAALYDLQVDSEATKSLNSDNLNLNKVPSHCISASIELADVLAANPTEEPAMIPFLLANLIDGLALNIYKDKNDIVVPLGSQFGVAEQKFSSHFDSKWHCNVHTCNESADRVVSLLSEVSNPEVFTTDGFVAKTLEYNPTTITVNTIPTDEITVKRNVVAYNPTTAVKSVVFVCLNDEGKIRGVSRSTTAPYDYKTPSLVRTGTVIVIAFAENHSINLSGPVAF